MKLESKLTGIGYKTLGKVFEYASLESNKDYVKVMGVNYDLTSNIKEPIFNIDVAFKYESSRECVEKLSDLMRIIDCSTLPNTSEQEELLGRSVQDENFSVRTRNCLENNGINTLGDLIAYTPRKLRNIRNLGEVSLREIKMKLKEYGLSLREKD